jgi:hypothetical protein
MSDDKTFIENVAYYWAEHRDPTRAPDWNRWRCKELCPVFTNGLQYYIEAEKRGVDDRTLRDLADLLNSILGLEWDGVRR